MYSDRTSLAHAEQAHDLLQPPCFKPNALDLLVGSILNTLGLSRPDEVALIALSGPAVLANVVSGEVTNAIVHLLNTVREAWNAVEKGGVGYFARARGSCSSACGFHLALVVA